MENLVNLMVEGVECLFELPQVNVVLLCFGFGFLLFFSFSVEEPPPVQILLVVRVKILLKVNFLFPLGHAYLLA